MTEPTNSAATRIALPHLYGQHYPLIKSKIPDSLVKTTPELRAALKQIRPKIHRWYSEATQAQKATLRERMEALMIAQKRQETIFKPVQSAEDFARPLLESALQEEGHPLPVDDVFLHMYVPATDAFGVNTGGYASKTLSLLQAALHNFEAPETEADYFGEHSGFITRPDALGRYKPYPEATLTVEAFTALCRRLDVGAKYQVHLELYLSPTDVESLVRLEGGYVLHQKAMLKADAYIALLKKEIAPHEHDLLMRVINDERAIKSGGRQVWYRRPAVMGFALNGCVIFDLCKEGDFSETVIVWIPGDPEHPLKKYSSYFDFRDELLRQLTPSPSALLTSELTPYQQFLGRFIDEKDRPDYYRRLTELIKDAPQRSWAEDVLRSEKAQFFYRTVAATQTVLITVKPNPDEHERRIQRVLPSVTVQMLIMGGDDLWRDVYLWDEQLQNMRAHLLANARNRALPTADADANHRSARLSHFLNIGLFGINLLAMVVPPLGQAMMVLMVGQLLYETIQGIEEWSEGDTEAAWGHISDVLDNLATIAEGAAVFHVAVNPVVAKLKVLTLRSGTQRLWNGDLTAYEHPIEIGAGTKPDEVGLYRINNQDVLLHEGKAFVLEEDSLSGHHRAVHPSRAEAYKPEFRYNGHGVWVHEGESPTTWSRHTLLRRLGASVQGLTDDELEQALNVSGVHEDDLRRMYVENEPTPLLLSESIRQFKAYRTAMKAIDEVKTGHLSSDLCSYGVVFTVELPGWPPEKAIELYDPAAMGASAVRYGSLKAIGKDVITISRADLMNGELPGRVLDALNQKELHSLLGERLPFPRAERIDFFKEKLAEHMGKNQYRLYRTFTGVPFAPGSPERAPTLLLTRLFPALPTEVARRLVIEANPVELASLKTGKVPARLMQSARTLQRNARLSSAYLGLYLNGLVTADTETLVLNTLENIPGWKNNLRLEIRADTYSGELRASFGAEDASERKVLVRVSDGKYLAYNGDENPLHGADDLYASLQHALSDPHRKSLGLPHVGQGAALKIKIQQHALPREQLAELMKLKSTRLPSFLTPRYFEHGRLGYSLSGRGVLPNVDPALQARLKALYPSMTAEQARGFFDRYGGQALEKLIQREAMFNGLKSTLERWYLSDINGVAIDPNNLLPDHTATLSARHLIKTRLVEAWQRTGREHPGFGHELIFEGGNYGAVLETLPELNCNFDHVTKVELIQAHITDGISRFLSQFKKVRWLDLSGNQLTRLPGAIGDMRHLKMLDLMDNQIVLSADAVTRLSNLTRLEALALGGSPLSRVPDISRMPNLKSLYLNGCELDRWPEGLFASARNRDFKLFLQGNPLTEIPDVALGSEQAGILARTQVTPGDISTQVYDQLRAYRSSVGIDPDRLRPPGLRESSRFWTGGMSRAETETHQALWDRIELSTGSEPFFKILSDQAAYMKDRQVEEVQAFQRDMTLKIWRMLRAMDENSVLRDKIFEMALAPVTCVDAGAQLFNALGVEVLKYEAYTTVQPKDRTLNILKLARGKTRLDEVNKIAKIRIQELEAAGHRFPVFDEDGAHVRNINAEGHELFDIDEVEVYLRFTTDLGQRLELPWQSPSMRFSAAGVTDELINSAYDQVLSKEKGAGLRNRLLEEPIWTEYLGIAYAQDISRVALKFDALIDLQAAQRSWAEGIDLSDGQKAELRSQIENAAQILKKSASDITPGKVMTDAEYDEGLEELTVELLQNKQILTDLALKQASMQPPAV